MSTRASTWLAWSLAALGVGMFITSIALIVLSFSGASGTQLSGDWGIAGPGSVPFTVAVGAIADQWLWIPVVGLFGTYLILLFPDGRLPPRRWRHMGWFSAAVIVLLSVSAGLAPERSIKERAE